MPVRACHYPPGARPLLLKDVRNDMIGAKPLPLPAVFQAFLLIPMLQPLDERRAACILGVKAWGTLAELGDG